MKLLIATPLYPPEMGGPATYAALLKKCLPERGFDVAVVSFRSVRKYPKIIRHVVYFFRIYVRSKNTDVIFALDPVSVGLPAMLAARLRRKPFFLRIAGDYAWEQGVARFKVREGIEEFVTPKPFLHYSLPVTVLRHVERYVARRARRIIVPSAYLASQLKRWGIPKELFQVVYNAVPDLSDEGNRETLRAMLKVRGELIVTAGRLIPLKNFEGVIDAVANVRKEFPAITLLIIGGGPHQESIERYIAARGAEDFVVLTGPLEQDVLFRYIKAADVFVLNSWHETFSHIILEALSLQVPVVATCVGGNPEILTDKKEGLLVPSKDTQALTESINTLLAKPHLARLYGTRGAERARTFTLKRLLQDTEKTLRNI